MESVQYNYKLKELLEPFLGDACWPKGNCAPAWDQGPKPKCSVCEFNIPLPALPL